MAVILDNLAINKGLSLTLNENKTLSYTKYRINLFVLSGSLIVVFLFLGLRNISISNENLINLKVTIASLPVYHTREVKGTTYKSITFKVVEYPNTFKISSFTYKSTNHDYIKANFKKFDTVWISINKSTSFDTIHLKAISETIEIYRLQKNGIQVIDLNRRNWLAKRDQRWAFIFVGIGILILPYGFIRKKPLISLTFLLIVASTLGAALIFIRRHS